MSTQFGNGVKETTPGGYLGSVEMKGKTVHQFEHSKQDDDVKDVIKNGIKHTEISWSNFDRVDDVLEKSIKKTEAAALFDESKIDTVISEGIKETHDDVMPHTGRVEGVIKNGVKKTVDALSSRLPNPVKDVIKNGVKICIPSRTPLYNPMDFSVQYRENHRLDDVASVLEKGIKEVQPLPSQEGNMDWGNYYHKQEDRTKPHTKYVDDVDEFQVRYHHPLPDNQVIKCDSAGFGFVLMHKSIVPKMRAAFPGQSMFMERGDADVNASDHCLYLNLTRCTWSS